MSKKLPPLILLYLCLSLVLLSCQTDTDTLTTPTASAPNKVPVISADAMDMRGHVLMPSGLAQTQSGLVLPSGILLPSGLVLPSGLTGFQTLADTPPRIDELPFDVTIYVAHTNHRVVTTQTTGRGAYLVRHLPPGLDLRIVAQAQDHPDLRFECYATTPDKSERVLSRNFSTRTTAAALLGKDARAAGHEFHHSHIQHHPDFADILDRVTSQLEAVFGSKPLESLADVVEDHAGLLAQVKALAHQNPKFKAPFADEVNDEPIFAGDFDGDEWPYETAVHYEHQRIE